MSTTDTDALKERMARALAKQDGYDPDNFCDEWIMYGMRESAAAVLPIVAEEVRKAKAEALREAADILECHPLDEPDAAHTPNWLYGRAVEYETGDSDEHR